MFITKKHISRRLVLRGMGVSLALPFLDSMAPAQTPLRKTAEAKGSGDFSPLWAGQNAGECRELGAAEITRQLGGSVKR